MIKKPTSLLLPAIFLLSILLLQSSCALAASDSPQLRLSIATNQSHYATGETAWLTLTIENISDTDCYDVDVTHLLPNGLQYADSAEGHAYFPVIPAGSMRTCTVGIREPSSAVSITVTSDKKAYRLGDIATFTLTIKNNTASPLYDVELLQLLPEGLVCESGSDDSYAYIDMLAPYEAITRTYLVSSAYPEVLVTIDADQESYSPGETACLTLSIRNRSNETLTDVSVEHFLPEGMIYDLEHKKNTFQFVSIAPGESAECRVYVRYVESNLPETGDSSAIWFILFAASVLVLALVRFVQPFTGGKTHD